MEQKGEPNKILRQHLEMEAFFVGDFTIRRPAPAAPRNARTQPGGQEIAAMNDSLETIAVEVGACRKCEIGTTRLNAVPGQGSPAARLMFVGEGPGADEDQQGLAFVGRAGKLLTDIITAMGLKRQEVFIGNVIKCRPPENRDPKAEEILNCWPFLKRQLELIRPDVIVALGAHAARTLLKTDEPIGKLRGRFHEYRFSEDAPPAKLMPTYHPAYLLRNYSYDNRKRVWEDMLKVLNELGLPVPEKKK
ncbi:MAG: uracil-DNA glycosylase [Planctomycetales bacterium]|nr:uracil-DNA glycosylase [Planctomycetales bacterium]